MNKGPDQGCSKRIDRVDNIQRPRGSRGSPTKMNPKNNIGLGAPHCSLSMSPRGSCYACSRVLLYIYIYIYIYIYLYIYILSYFSFQPGLQDWCTKGRGMCVIYELAYIYASSFTKMERDVVPWYSVCSWCEWSSDRSIMVDPLRYFSFQPVFYDWCNRGRGMCYPVCEMVHIKEPLVLIDKRSPCSGGNGFPLTLSEWFFTI